MVQLVEPRDCLAELWELARGELAAAHVDVTEEYRPRVARFIVSYAQRQVEGVSGGMIAADGGFYDWNDGAPKIDIYRAGAPLPAAVFEPDMLTRPTEDACFLAHEMGHFRSDPDGRRTLAPYIALSKRAPLSATEKRTIIEEERTAWRIGREILAGLGCHVWGGFDRLSEANLGGYEDGLANYQPSA